MRDWDLTGWIIGIVFVIGLAQAFLPGCEQEECSGRSLDKCDPDGYRVPAR